jgi:two-component system alkaline phosphatase synthesis response regulator PhoP
MKKKILVVDDEVDIVELIRYNLEKEGYDVLSASDGEKALEIVRKSAPDLVILDLMLPVIAGLEVCRFIRKDLSTEHLPIIMLTAKTEDLDKIIGLELGADDYITKPFNVRELISRIRAVLRRAEKTQQTAPDVIELGDIRIDLLSYEVFVGGQRVEISPKEIKLLRFLMERPGRVFSRDQLIDAVWGDETFVEHRTVDVHISRLRSAIEKDNDHPKYILTVRSLGYKFTDARLKNS